MKKIGVINRWDAVRGFGFIRSRDVPVDVFFHVNVFSSRVGLTPCQGMQVSFDEIHLGGKGPKAIVVIPFADTRPETKPSVAAAPPRSGVAGRMHHRQNASRTNKKFLPASRVAAGATPPQRLSIFLATLTVWIGLIVYGLALQRLTVWALVVLVAFNITVIFMYAFDKNAAEKGWWRTREDTFHFVSLAGGWPASWLAQQVMRHKTGKKSFQSTYWTTVWLHCAALAAWVFWLYENVSGALVSSVLP